MSAIRDLRLHLRNEAPERPGGRYVFSCPNVGPSPGARRPP